MARCRRTPTALSHSTGTNLVELRPAVSVGVDVADLQLGPPVPRPPLVLAVVANYPPTERPIFPMIVGKSPSAVTGPFDDIVLPHPGGLPLGEAFVIPEPELAVVTTGAGRHLSVAEAETAIAGYTVAQDITERHHEFGPARSPWTWDNLPAKTLGKSFDTFLPIGPVIATTDEPGSLHKRCWINDELVYEQRHDEMLWSPAELVSLVSRFMSLQAGTLILCGSGGRRDSQAPAGLAAGDILRTEIDGVGTMENRCRQEDLAGEPEIGVVVREVVLAAEPDVVFSFLTRPELHTRWFGDEVVLEPIPGGRYELRLDGGAAVAGEYVEVTRGRRVVVTFGWDVPNTPAPPGSTTVEYSITAEEAGARLRLVHSHLPASTVAAHEAGWDHYLAELKSAVDAAR